MNEQRKRFGVNTVPRVQKILGECLCDAFDRTMRSNGACSSQSHDFIILAAALFSRRAPRGLFLDRGENRVSIFTLSWGEELAIRDLAFEWVAEAVARPVMVTSRENNGTTVMHALLEDILNNWVPAIGPVSVERLRAQRQEGQNDER